MPSTHTTTTVVIHADDLTRPMKVALAPVTGEVVVAIAPEVEVWVERDTAARWAEHLAAAVVRAVGEG